MKCPNCDHDPVDEEEHTDAEGNIMAVTTHCTQCGYEETR